MTASVSGGGAPARHRGLALALRVASWVTLVLAVVGATAPGDAGEAAAQAMVVLLIAAPTGRVAWLAVRWLRKGDRRYGLRALLLVSVVAVTGVASLLV
ncbi:MAG TPA: hypothetical protein VMN58_11035 [Acidimicrobiales bacterium]|nr:hypothetical protein [Acidimicrobiales bacterium]